MKLRTVLQNVPDPRGKQGQDYFLWSILGLIVVSLLCGRRGMLAAFHLGRCLNKRQRVALGFTKGVTPCHATLTELSPTLPSSNPLIHLGLRRTRTCFAVAGKP